jgi:hypothetical protein
MTYHAKGVLLGLLEFIELLEFVEFIGFTLVRGSRFAAYCAKAS